MTGSIAMSSNNGKGKKGKQRQRPQRAGRSASPNAQQKRSSSTASGQQQGQQQQQQQQQQQGGQGQQQRGPSGGSSSYSGPMASPFSSTFSSFVRGAASSAASATVKGLGGGWGGSGGGDEAASGTPGAFDMYLLAVSWAPRFCCTNEKQCKAEKMDGFDDLSIHGLWPAYSAANKEGRTYPAFCAALGQGEKAHGRAGHEYAKHGTCTTLGKTGYAAEEERVADGEEFDELRDLLSNASPQADGGPNPVSLAEVLGALGGERRAAVMVDKACRLAELTMCYRKAADGSVGERVDCPPHILGSGRNSAVLQGCQLVHLDQAGSCAVISKDLLKSFKAAGAALE